MAAETREHLRSASILSSQLDHVKITTRSRPQTASASSATPLPRPDPRLVSATSDPGSGGPSHHLPGSSISIAETPLGRWSWVCFGSETSTPTSSPATPPTEHERLMAVTRIAEHAEQAGFDVFAFGEHRNPPFLASSPPTVLG